MLEAMSTKTQITGRLVAAARTLTGMSLDNLSRASGVPSQTLAQMEASGAAELHPDTEAEAIQHALERYGAVFLAEGDGMGAGVRLKFSRQDVKQISRMEGEGGIARDDDVP